MPSDVEMSDCDSSPFDGQIDLDPTIASYSLDCHYAYCFDVP
jgi:hypothetical protein